MASLEIENTQGLHEKQANLQKTEVREQGSSSGPATLACISLSRGGLFGSRFTSSTFATVNRAAMSAPAPKVRVERPPSAGSLFALFMMGGVLSTMIFVPVIEKGQNLIRNWLGSPDSSSDENSYSNSLKGQSFKESVEILKEYNNQNLDFFQAQILLEKIGQIDSKEIERLLRTKEVKFNGSRNFEEG